MAGVDCRGIDSEFAYLGGSLVANKFYIVDTVSREVRDFKVDVVRGDEGSLGFGIAEHNGIVFGKSTS